MLLHSWTRTEYELSVERIDGNAIRITDASNEFSLIMTENEALGLAEMINRLLAQPAQVAA